MVANSNLPSTSTGDRRLGWVDCLKGIALAWVLRHPEVSSAILDKKLASVEATGADCVVACDAGCLMQMGGGLARRGSRVRAVHLAQVLEGGAGSGAGAG